MTTSFFKKMIFIKKCIDVQSHDTSDPDGCILTQLQEQKVSICISRHHIRRKPRKAQPRVTHEVVLINPVPATSGLDGAELLRRD